MLEVDPYRRKIDNMQGSQENAISHHLKLNALLNQISNVNISQTQLPNRKQVITDLLMKLLQDLQKLVNSLEGL